MDTAMQMASAVDIGHNLPNRNYTIDFCKKQSRSR